MTEGSKKWALYRAKMAVNMVAYAGNQYSVKYPWRDIDGAITETRRDSYTNARATCANMRAYWAMICMGYDPETATWATHKTMWRGSARDQLSQACRMAQCAALTVPDQPTISGK